LCVLNSRRAVTLFPNTKCNLARFKLDSQSILIDLLQKTEAELIMHRISRPDVLLRQFPSNKSHKSTRIPLFPVRTITNNKILLILYDWTNARTTKNCSA